MRQPRPADVLEAVRHVTGVDPSRSNKLERRSVASRRLAVAALREICDLTYVQCAHELGYADHSTPLHHARGNVDMRLLKAVLQRVSDKLEEEEAAEQARRMEVAAWRL
jgi:chromosomal replication initiation ATPase DnaA